MDGVGGGGDGLDGVGLVIWVFVRGGGSGEVAGREGKIFVGGVGDVRGFLGIGVVAIRGGGGVFEVVVVVVSGFGWGLQVAVWFFSWGKSW